MFLEYLNKFHPSIKFTAQWSSKSVKFLHSKVWVDDEGCLTTDLYMKPTDTHEYFHRDSCHPGHCKRSIPYSQALRIHRICSETRDCLKRTEELKEILVNWGYEESDVQSQIDRAKGFDREALLQPKKRTNTLLEQVPLIVT